MAYHLGEKSLLHMRGVRSDMCDLIHATIKDTPQDFCILNSGGLRTTAMQQALFARKASKVDGVNRLSKHQKQEDGWGWAIDLVPYEQGDPRWEWALIYPIAATMAIHAQDMGIFLRWGGVWDRKMREYVINSTDHSAQVHAIQTEVTRYTVRHPGPDFIDGPHYELLK